MPLIRIIEITPATKLGLWEITEEADELKWALQWGQEDIKRYQSINDTQRCLHWLASRVLLRKLLQTEKFIDLQQDEYGKPYIKNLPVEISISHSGSWVAVMLSDKACGVDIQHMDRQMDRLAVKFISEEEKEFIKTDLSETQLYIYWCSKEALYKLYGKKKLDFKANIFIQPFDEHPKGCVVGRIEKENLLKDYKVNYEKIADYMLAYVLNK